MIESTNWHAFWDACLFAKYTITEVGKLDFREWEIILSSNAELRWAMIDD